MQEFGADGLELGLLEMSWFSSLALSMLNYRTSDGETTFFIGCLRCDML